MNKNSKIVSVSLPQGSSLRSIMADIRRSLARGCRLSDVYGFVNRNESSIYEGAVGAWRLI
ncbi:hypothetical protein HMPREF0972_01335 [Actinomyces sp. oral taxon 848 str. F0332]|nr:hypothetical protein HMPREF0972_01335 [Actinomyces sp. oral taxon 848 str. F0332]